MRRRLPLLLGLALAMGAAALALHSRAAPGREIVVQQVNDPDHPGWMSWDVVIPSSLCPLRCDADVYVDGVNRRGGSVTPLMVRNKPQRVRVRISDDDDTRVKDILKAQGLPIKPHVYGYAVDVDMFGVGTHRSQPWRFKTGRGGMQASTGGQGTYTVGQNIMLCDLTYFDQSIRGYPDQIYDNDPSWAPHFAPDTAHRLTVKLRFVPETDRVILDTFHIRH